MKKGMLRFLAAMFMIWRGVQSTAVKKPHTDRQVLSLMPIVQFQNP